MSADLPGWDERQAAETWKLSFACTRAQAEAIAGDPELLAALDPPPTLMTSEPDPAAPHDWRLDAYFEGRPDDRSVALVRELAADGQPFTLERIADADWVTLSQASLTPIHAGRFWVHTPEHGDADASPGTVRFAIPAGRAFGTGHHETTTGCLLMLDRLAREGRRFADIADIGTGAGLLAFAARALWPTARVAASDIDPVAVAVAVENAAANVVPLGRGRGRIELVVAAGLDHPRLRARAPYDLLIANILAGPLIELAPAFARALAPGGSLLLAGLLRSQAEPVAAGYRRAGLRLADTIMLGDWPTLRMVKRPVHRRARGCERPRFGDWASDGQLSGDGGVDR